MSDKKMGMTTTSRSAQKLIQLLRDEFQLPPYSVDAVISITTGEVVSIKVDYLPVQQEVDDD